MSLERTWLITAYGVFTAYAAVFAGLSGGHDQVWAIWAVSGYALGTLLLWWRRTGLALVVSLALALVAPLIWVSLDVPLADGIVVIHRSAELLLHHGSPYLPKQQLVSYLSYNPYLPVMALFGLPHAAGLTGLAGNAGVWLAIGTVVVLTAAFWVMTPEGPQRREQALRAAAIAVASPVIALNLAVVTTDPPVLAFMLLSLALAARPGRNWTIWSAVALAAACMLKDTAWLAIPVMAAMYWSRESWRAAVRFVLALLAAALLLVAVLAPATLYRPAAMVAMVRDTVLFPLGLTTYKTPAASLLPGHLLTSMGTAGHVLSVGLLLVAALAIAVSLVVWPLRDVRAAAWRLAIGLTLIFALGPDVRFGYFIYPLGLLGWLALTRPDVPASPPQVSEPAHSSAQLCRGGGGRLRVNPGSREHFDGAVFLADQQFDLGAAEDDAFGAVPGEGGDDVPVSLPGVLAERPHAQFLEDHAVHDLALRLIRDDHVDAEGLHPPLVEAVLHGEARAEQAERGEPGRASALGGRVDDMDKGDGNGCLHRGRHLVHGVAADQQQFGACGRQPFGRGGQFVARLLPASGRLPGGDAVEIKRMQQQRGRMQPAMLGLG